MFRRGLGETSTFASFHPVVNIIYFVLAIGITMFSLSPLFLTVTFVFSWIYSILLNGAKVIKINLCFTVSVIFIMAIINTLFIHNGDTVLFYLNTNRITLEAFIFGICASIMLVSMIVWFSCFNAIMSNDKLIYIFGKAAPVLGLTLSMIFRFIPLLKARFEEIRLGQSAMGTVYEQNYIGKARLLIKEISILISWSLEASIESGDSMEARGYGLKGRTSFHLFKFEKRDAVLLIFMVLSGAMVTSGVMLGRTNAVFYPGFSIPNMDGLTFLAIIAFIVLLGLPIAIDLRGEIKWQKLSSEM